MHKYPDSFIQYLYEREITGKYMSFWVNPYFISGSGLNACVAITQDDDALNYGKVRVDFSNNQMNLYARGSTGPYSTTLITLNTWMHLVLIRENLSTKYYVDNNLVLTSTADGIGST